MAISRRKKEELVEEIAEKIKSSKSVVFADYRGLSVEEINEVRSEVAKQGLEMKVIKRSLFAIASKEAGADIDVAELKGHPIVYVFGPDETSGAKIVHDFAQKNDKLEMIGGILDRKPIAIEELKTLATMPSKEEMYAKMVGTLAAPLRGLSLVLSGNLRGLVSVLNQQAEKGKNIN